MMRAFGLLGLIGVVFAAPALADETRGGDHALAFYVGRATDTNFTTSMFVPWDNELKDIGLVAGAYSYRFGSIGDVFGEGTFLDDFTVEGEVGVSGRFGDESLGEAWTGLYLRYDGFFWNDVVYTTIAVNTGVSYLTDFSEFERGRDSGGRNSKLLHYMGPELTFALPDHKNIELLLRYHHRSGVFGLFDDVVSGSTFISTGLRFRF
jgi:hypothetical protein